MIANIIEIIVIMLLICTMVFCMRLNKRITIIRDSKKELLESAYSLEQTIKNANESILNLQRASYSAVEINRSLQASKTAIADLEFMIPKAESLLNKLEEKIRQANSLQYSSALNNTSVMPANDIKSTAHPLQTAQRKSVFSKATQDLLQAIKVIQSGLK